MPSREQIWELKKMIIPTKELLFSKGDLSDNVPQIGNYIDKRFKKLEFWEKDMYLATFQKSDFICVHRDQYGSKNLKKHEERTGCSYDEVKTTKDFLKYLITNGACINSKYINFIEITKSKKRIIDRLEELFNLCIKPLSLSVCFDKIENYKVENNQKNRFIIKYYNLIKSSDINLSIDEMYDLWVQNEEYPKELL